MSFQVMIRGFSNENELVNFYNNKSISDFNNQHKSFLKKIFHIDKNKKIYANKVGGHNKTDITLIHKAISVNLSIKIGRGNSTHQEKIEFFNDFLIERFSINKEIQNNFKLFVWGDGTLDGKAHPSKKYINGKEFLENHPECISSLKNFLKNEEVKYSIIKRAIFKGRVSLINPTIIFHGNVDNFNWCFIENFINALCNHKSKKALLPVGGITAQPWNRTNEKKRGSIQFKIGDKTKLIRSLTPK